MSLQTKTSTLERSAGSDKDVFLSLDGMGIDRGKRRVLDGFSLTVRRGEIFGLLGPNGAGKSSAFQALAGLIPARAGTLTLEGRPVPIGSGDLRSRMGIVFQSPALDLRLSATENLDLASRLYGLSGTRRRERVKEMISFAQLEGREREPVKQLSGGMRRRLELGRSLLASPSFLLMDEPTTGLDEPSFQQVWKKLRQLARERHVTVLLTTHRAEEAELCDRLAFLHRGKIVAEGTPDELRNRVGGDVIELVTEGVDDVLQTLESSLGVTGELAADKVRIVAERGHELIPRIVEALPRGSLRSISMHRPGLGDVFLTLTGSALDADAGIGGEEEE